MDREELNEWRAQRGDEPGALWAVLDYIQSKYPSEEWPAQEVQFVEKVEAEAKEVYEDRGPPGIEGERDRIDDHVEKQQERFQRVYLDKGGFELIAAKIRITYSDFEGRVIEDLKVVPRGAFVRDLDGPEGPEGLHAPEGPLVLRPAGETYRLEPTVRLLEGYEMPTDVLRHYSFGVLQVTDKDTWEDVEAMVEEQLEFKKETARKARQELKFLRARREVYDALLERRAKGRDMPWETLTEADAQEDVEESQSGRKSTLNDPETYPAVTLRAVLEWVGDDKNRAKPFRSESQSSLCGFVSERLEEKVGYQVPQDTIKTRLQSLMSELGVELPHGHTNTRSYFESREEITEAMQKHGLSV
jgi:hypothetical protein